MIEPTIGRVVLFHPAFVPDSGANEITHAAIVTYVHGPNWVNLAVFDSNGNPYSQTSVFLYQGDTDRPAGPYAEWMPYQIAKAAEESVIDAAVETDDTTAESSGAVSDATGTADTPAV